MTKTIRKLFVLAFLALVPTIAAWGQTVVITNGTDLGVWSIGEVQIPLTATGGNGTYTWDITSGALPAGLAIRTDVPSGFGSAQAGIIGVATTQGTAHFTLRVTSSGASATQPVTLRITSLTAQDDGQLPDGFVGVPYSYTFTPVGNTGAVLFSTSITVGTPGAVANPFRLTAAGLLSGNPIAAGNYNVSLSFTDQTTGDTCLRTFSIYVSPLQITSPGLLPNATQNSTYNYRVTAHGGDGNYSFSSNGGLPDGLSIDPTSGVISGTVNAYPSRYSFYIVVSDPGYGNYSKQMDIDVIGVTPTLPSQFVYGTFLDDCTVGLTCSRGIGNSSGKAPFAWTVSGLPQGMTFRPYDAPNGPPGNFLTPGDVELYGTPLVAGNFNVTVTVTDANSNSATQVYALHVSNLMIDPGMAGGSQGTPYSFTFRVLGGAGPYAAQNLNFYSGYYRLPDGLSLSGLKVSGTPLEDGGFGPRFHFTDSAGGSLTVTQYPYFNGPTANPIWLSNYDTFFLTVNQIFSLQVCCGVSFTETGSLPSGLTFSSAGLLSGTPTVVGTYPILITASSGTDSGSREIILAVTPLAPTTNGNLPFGNVGAFYSQPLSASGGTGSLTWTLVPGTYLPPGLSIVGSTLSGTPTGPGQFYFSLVATDSVGNSTRAYFNLAIYPNGATPPLFINQNANLGSYFIGDDQIQLFAGGGTGTYTWSLKAGSTLPPGCALRTDTPPWWSGVSAGILCLATTPGNYSFTLTVTSGSQSVSQLYTLRISNLMKMDTNLPDAFVNRPYSYTVTPIHADGTSVGTVTYGSPSGLPPGMTFSNGTLSGTPTASGYYGVNFTISDGVDTMTAYFGVNVFLVHIDSPGVLPNATQYAAYSYTLTASGGVAPYTFSASYVPYGFSLNSSTGAITGTINQYYEPGPSSFQVTATDSNQVSYVKTMVIDVIGVPPTLPWIPSLGLGDCSVGVGCDRSVQVLDGGTAPFTWKATGLPPGMGFRQGSGGNNGNMASYVTPVGAELWGIPTQVGSYTIVATVTDVNGVSTTQNLSLCVSPLFIDSGFASGTYNVPYTSTLHVVGGSGSYTRQVVPGTGSFPSGTALSGMTLSGTPVENGNFGEYLVISDTTLPAHNTVTQYMGLFVGGASGTTIQIQGGNLGSWLLGNPINYTLYACCVPSYTWTFISGSFPPGSPAFALSSAGVITGTPTTAGTYSFLVQAADQINPANFARSLITITVTPISIATGSLPYGNVSAAYSQTLSATGGVGAITWSVLQTDSPLPPGLSLNPATGVISGKPTSTGQYNFAVMATDTAGNSATGYFTINIYAFGAGPPLSLNFGPNLGTFSIGNVLEYPLTASGGVPPYTYSLTPGAANVPGMRVISYSPWPFYPATVTGGYVGLLATAGTFNSSIRVVDSAGTILDQPINLTVLPITVLTSYTLPYATLGQPYSFQFTGYGGSGNYSWTLYNPPAALSGFTFSGVTPGQLTGTPTASGNFNFTVTMQDLSNNTQVSFGFDLSVNPFAITNNAVLPQGTVGHAYLQTLTAPNCGPGCVWSVPNSNLAPGLSLQASNSGTALASCTEATGVTCVIAGTPTAASWASLAVTATGSSGTAAKVLGIEVLNPPQPLTMVTTSIGNGTVGAQSSTQLTAQGGSPPYSWSVTGGSLPPGVSLAGPGETLSAYFMPGFTYLWGRPMAPGSYNFALTVKDANNNSVSRNFTWYIQQTALATSYLPVSATLVVGTPYSESLLGLGGTGTYTFATTSATGPMPSGLTLSPAGVVSGTPLNSGSYSVPIQMTDSAAHVFLTYLNLSIGSGTPSTVYIGAGPFLGTIQLGNSTLFSLSPSGGTGPYTFSVPTTAPATPSNALPPGCGLEFGPTALINSASYYLACHPLAAGTYSFLLEVQDSAGNVGYKTLTITFAPFTLYSSALQSGTVGVPYSDTLPVWDNSGTVSWSVVSGTVMPPGLSISGNTISGTPTTPGNYTFTLSATDASGAVVSFGFSLTVSTLNITDPQALPIATLGVPYSFTFHATGGTAALTWSVTGLSSPLTLSPTTGVLSGTPTSTNTSSRIQVTVTDGYTTYSKAFTLWIRNQYPQELNYSLSGANLPDAYIGQDYAVALLPTGGLPPAYWTLVPGFSLPPGLSLATGTSLSPNLIPNATYLAGAPSTAGFYTFNMIMTDTAGNQTLRTFTLNVSPMGILSTALLTATEGVAYNQQFTAVGGTPPYTFTYRILSISTPMFPPGITGSPAGLISGTPTSCGSYSFFVTVADTAGHTFTTSISLSVVGPTRISFNAAQLFNLTAGVGTANTPNITTGATYTYSLLSGVIPAGLTLNPTGSPYLISGAPTAAGPYTFTVRATDTSNPANFADRTFSGSVSPMMAIIPKQTEVPAGRVGAPYSYSYRVAGGTPPYTFQESPLYPIPPGLALSPSGTLSGTPQVAGTFSFYATVTDSFSASMTTSLGTMNVITPGQANPMTPIGGSQSASVATPAAFELDGLVQGGAPPYVWTVATGSSLPPGMSIAPGSNGVSAFLVGIPTTPGAYAVVLTATDAALQSVNVSLSVAVGPVSVTPAVLPNGVVGSPYTAALSVSGGTAPYTIALWPTSDLPVGLTMSPAGVLSGTPQQAGRFQIIVVIADSAANVQYRIFTVGIDRAGQAPAIGISPTATQMSYVRTSPAPSPIQVNITGTSAGLPYTAMVSGVPGASLSATSGNAPGSLNLSLNTTGLTPGVYAGVVAVNSVNSTNTFQGVPFVLTVTDPPPCSYTLSSNAGSVASGPGTGSFSMATGSLCAWTATVPNPADNWITIASGGGIGPGDVSFNATANAGTASRAGTILAGGQNYRVTQFGSACSLAISPSAISVTAAGGVATINVNSNGACPWTASGLGATPTSGTGNGQVQVTIPPTASGNPPPLTATIAGQTLTVNQSGAACVASLDASSASYGAGSGSGSVNVSIPSGCSYSTVLGPSWITITSNASGSGPGPVNLAYTVAANSTTVARSGTLSIGGQTYQIAQSGIACSVTVDASASGSPFGSAGGSGAITVTANGSNCSWTASSAAAWASVTPSSGTGNATLTVNATSNSGSASSRATNFTIAGTSVGIVESGITCTYALGSTAGSVPSTGGSGSVGVIAAAACPWTASSTPGGWANITPVNPVSSSGSADVLFTASANPGALPRTTTFTIAGITYSLSQAGAPCAYSLSSTNTTAASTGDSGSYAFTAAPGCSAAAVSYSSWIAVSTSSAPDGSSGTVNYTVAANVAGGSRTGYIQLPGQSFTIVQTGAPCAYSFNSYGQAFASAGGPGSVLGSPSAGGCVPTVGTTQPTIVTLGTLQGPVLDIFTLPYTVLPFTSVTPAIRYATITFGGQFFTVKQRSW